MLAWLPQGVYGKMTDIANAYRISRTLLYQLLLMANLQLETLLSDAKLLLQQDPYPLDPLLFLLRLEGKCSLLSIASILQALEYHPNSVGSLRQCLHRTGQRLPSTRVIPSKQWVFYLSDEIFAIHAPILVTLDARSTTILNIALASDRAADTWSTHCEALAAHQVFSLGMASDRGLGLGAGDQAACDMTLGVTDYVHEFRALCAVLHPWERTAYAAIGQEDDAAHQFARAQRAAQLAKRLHQYDTAQHACAQAMALYDHLAMLLHLRREAVQ
jgi:hypothetical protein